MIFFTGMDDLHHAGKVDRAFVSVHRLARRRSAFAVGPWIMDSGAFTTIAKHGGYPNPVAVYAEQIRRWAGNGELLAAVAQDFMCEPWMVERTGLTVADHQRLTIERYDELLRCGTGGVYVLPVLQGYAPQDYVCHVRAYGDRLALGAWVGVGSVCKRNRDAGAIEGVLLAIKRERPDLRLHGFGVKTTSLGSGLVRELLYSADSMAWSFAARWEGRSAHDPAEAVAYGQRIGNMRVQGVMSGLFL